eukprot:NODE_6_length_70510_cov_1.054395.p43 type:complete len:201 gc:universal NODE_6_length_70510_cov_1.054395:24720-25322(+)
MKRSRDAYEMNQMLDSSPRKRNNQCPPMLREFLGHLPKDLLIDMLLADKSIDSIDIPIEIGSVISFLDSLYEKLSKLLPSNDFSLYAYDRVKSVLFSIKEAILYFTPRILCWEYFVFASDLLLKLPNFEQPANHTKLYLLHYLSSETKAWLEQTRVMPLFANQYLSILSQRAKQDSSFEKLLELFNAQYSWMVKEVSVHS